MTAVEILFRYAPSSDTEAVVRALASAREVYGIRRLKFDSAARTLRVEYDATRLNAAAVTKLLSQAGLQVECESLQSAPPDRAPLAAEKAPAA